MWYFRNETLSFSIRTPAQLFSRLSSAVKQQLCYAVGIIGMKLIGFMLLPWITTVLGVTEYARLESLMALINGAIVITGFGLVNNLYRLTGQANDSKDEQAKAADVFGSAIFITLFTVVLLIALMTVLLPWLNQFWAISSTEYTLIVVLISAESTLAVPLAWLRIKEQAGQFLVITLGRTLLYAMLTISFLQLDMGLTGLLLASVIAVSYQIVHLFWLQFRDTGFNIRYPAIKQQIRYGLPFIISGLAMYATQGLDIILLSQYIPAVELAAYALAIKFFLIAALLSQPFQLWWYSRRIPILNSENGTQKAADGAVAGAILAAALGLIVAVTAPVLTLMLFASEFAILLQYLPWLIIAGILKQWGALLNLGCFTTERSEIQMGIELTTGAICLIAFPLVIPEYGVQGALYCLTVSQLLRFIAYYLISQKMTALPYRHKVLLLPSIVCMALILLPLLIPGLYHNVYLIALYIGISTTIALSIIWSYLLKTNQGLLKTL